MKLDIEALKAAALAAGGRRWVATGDGTKIGALMGPGVIETIADANSGRADDDWRERRQADFTHIEASCPAAVLALIERLDQTERNRDMWKSQSERQAVALERQARAAKMGMDAAKANGAAMEENARRMLAESSPDALASEREANAILTAENERLREELRQIYSHQAELAGWKP